MTTDDRQREEAGDEESFADLLAQSYVDHGKLEPGQKVEATVLKIAGDWVFLDVGQKGEGVLEKKELLDAEGHLSVAEGDRLTVFFRSRAGGELRFSARIGGVDAGLASLEEACRGGIPVEGVVEKEVKGGYEVRVAGQRAFCPFSQIDLRRAETAEAYVGRHLSFRVTQFGERGRNIVLSRRALLEEEQRQKREALKGTLQTGMTVQGTVTRLQDFGAFVDLGGIDGLIPVSEVGWGRVEDIRERLQVGQQVEAVIKSIDWERERISLSLRETLADPWEQVPERFPEGSVHTGTVSRLAPFGAFVTLAEGIDGLLHISRLGGGKRLSHPREAVREGERVEVRIEKIDREARRLSLALAEFARAEEEATRTLEEFRRQAAAAPKGMGTLGDLLRAQQQKKGRK
jgi:small subunit ribosomal protein S1